MILEKKDFEASLECCFGDTLPGETGASGEVPNLGEAGPFSALICMSRVVVAPLRAGDRGGERGDLGESVDRALRVPI